MEIEIGSSLYDLFSNTDFRHWFFWTAVIFGLVAGWPSLIRIKKSIHKCCKGAD